MIGNFKQITPAQLEHIKRDPSQIESILYPQGGEVRDGSLDIDKAWQGIHFLLTGNPLAGQPPLSKAILGGVEIGGDVGYGPARYVTPDEVRDVAKALTGILKDELRRRFNPAALKKADIYPPIWDQADSIGYLLEYYDKLVAFYQDAAQKGRAVLVYIN